MRAVSSIYLFIAESKGFLAREGIRLEFIPIDGGTDKMVAALDQGKVDVAHTATPYLIQAELKGSDTVAIAGEVANPVYSLIVRPEIAGYADLKGKQIGLSLPVDTISISMRKLLAQNGLGSADYKVKELVGTPVRYDCLKSGECAGVPLGQPNDLEAIQQGYRRLGDSTQAVGAFQFQVIAVRRAFAAANKETVVHFVRALADAFRFIRDPANRPEVIKIVADAPARRRKSPAIRSRSISSPRRACCRGKPSSISRAWTKSLPSWARAAPSRPRCRRPRASWTCNICGRPAWSRAPARSEPAVTALNSPFRRPWPRPTAHPSRPATPAPATFHAAPAPARWRQTAARTCDWWRAAWLPGRPRRGGRD